MDSSVKPGLRLVDRLLLIGAWAISCSAVYGLGFYTGSQIQERVPDDEERIVRLPVTAEPPAVGQRAKAGDDFTFYETLVPGQARPRESDAVTADRSTPEPAPGKVEAGKTRSGARPSATAAKPRPKGATARAAVASTVHRAAPAGKTKAKSSAPGATASRAKAGPAKTRSLAATRDATAAAAKRAPVSGAKPNGHPSSATATASRSREERPAARTSRPREGVARSTVASE
jgi:hypothetical protein